MVDLNENQLDFGTISSTRMICPDIEVEQQLLKQLSGKSYQFKINSNQLVLLETSGNKIVMESN
ncbi:META domain-containing protein [Fulvivirga sp. 29W222]|uniref:META domain-containing protein n=1 Tax=Fulvivirga marina TaxID=2494733 RepID=A0A937KAN8_9BACT|nr:META domain-containing protein [Fulvivirga marina]MBL6445771.1 META domain-containing protein [Fulvivirga marina]